MTRWSELNVRLLRGKMEKGFHNPPDEFRPVPWLCYTGSLEKKRIHRAIDQMYEKGIRSFFIFPIYGMEVPYLSEEWFAIVKDTCEYCRAKKMTVWIYDDYDWPSGSCAGMLLARHPEHNIHRLTACCSEAVSSGKTIKLSYQGDIWRSYAYSRSGKYRPVQFQIESSGNQGRKTCGLVE